MSKSYYRTVKEKMSREFKNPFFITFLIALCIGVFLRFFRVPEFMTFLGDQGRDATIIKRIITGEHLPAIGPPTSYGQVYLGPFYYYFIAIWLFLFNFNPVGLAYGVAFFSSIYIIANYFIVKELFDEKVALLSTILIAFSFTIIDSSRFSWNPNLLPLATVLTIYAIIKALKTKRFIFFVLAGIFLSITVQLHYLSLFLIPGIILSFLYTLFNQKKLIKSLLSKYVIFFTSFIVFSFPLIIFDLRHQFLNSHKFLKLFSQSSAEKTSKIVTFFGTFDDLNKFATNIEFNRLIILVLLLVMVLFNWIEFKSKSPSRLFLLLFFANLLTFSLYSGPRFPHYFGTLLPLYYILIALIVSKLFVNKSTRNFISIAVFILIVAFVYIQAKSYYFMRGTASNQLKDAKNIARVIYENISAKEYRLTSLPQGYSDSTYRYFLEVWGKRPVEKDNIEKTTEFFVVCSEKCDPMNDGQYEIALFSPKKVEKKINTDNVIIYKLSNKQ